MPANRLSNLDEYRQTANKMLSKGSKLLRPWQQCKLTTKAYTHGWMRGLLVNNLVLIWSGWPLVMWVVYVHIVCLTYIFSVKVFVVRCTGKCFLLLLFLLCIYIYIHSKQHKVVSGKTIKVSRLKSNIQSNLPTIKLSPSLDDQNMDMHKAQCAVHCWLVVRLHHSRPVRQVDMMPQRLNDSRRVMFAIRNQSAHLILHPCWSRLSRHDGHDSTSGLWNIIQIDEKCWVIKLMRFISFDICRGRRVRHWVWYEAAPQMAPGLRIDYL